MSRIIVLTILYLSQVEHISLQIDKLACRQQKYGHAEKKTSKQTYRMQADKQTNRQPRTHACRDIRAQPQMCSKQRDKGARRQTMNTFMLTKCRQTLFAFNF